MLTLDNKLTPIYSPLPIEVSDPWEILEEVQNREGCSLDCLKYPKLPWALEALVGTTWRSLSTGEILHVVDIRTNHQGKLIPIAEEELAFFVSPLGTWHGDRFCVEYWIRVDHLPIESQLALFGVEVAYCREQIERLIRWPEGCKKARQELVIAVKRMQTFALQHGLPIPPGTVRNKTFAKPISSTKVDLETSDVRLAITEIGQYSFEKLSDLLTRTKNSVVLDVPCLSTRNYIEVAYDYLDALLVGETIAEHCETIYACEHYESRNEHLNSIRFLFQPKNVAELVKNLSWLSHGFIDFGDEETGEYSNFRIAIMDLEEELEKRVLRFPEIADSYLGNYVIGRYDLGEEALVRDNTLHPEHQYGFWRSFASNNVGIDFYISPSAWIIPSNTDISIPLVNYGGFVNGVPALSEATTLTVGSLPPLVFNQANIVYYPIDEVIKARQCAEAIYIPKSRDDYLTRSTTNVKVIAVLEVLLSEEGNLLVIVDNIAQYIFFNNTLPKVLPRIARLTVDSLHDILALTDGPSKITCPWEELDDDKFEELCYDIILSRHSAISSIRKIGRAHSRDGGRDIVFEVSGREGHPSTKWVVQCKLIRGNGSLAGSKINVSDTVDQYKARGFSVMTSGVIDSTLYDKLDAIAKNRGIQIDPLSRLDLERFLARHPAIRSRYFGASTEEKNK